MGLFMEAIRESTPIFGHFYQYLFLIYRVSDFVLDPLRCEIMENLFPSLGGRLNDILGLAQHFYICQLLTFPSLSMCEIFPTDTNRLG